MVKDGDYIQEFLIHFELFPTRLNLRQNFSFLVRFILVHEA